MDIVNFLRTNYIIFPESEAIDVSVEITALEELEFIENLVVVQILFSFEAYVGRLVKLVLLFLRLLVLLGKKHIEI